MPRADKAGHPTYWTTFGQGPRAALMIHCSLAHSGAWGRLSATLSGALEMVAFDLPGHGRSADWPANHRREIQGACVEIAAEFLDGPTDIIGHSFGATVALRLALERPDLVRSLTLIEPVFFAVAFADHPEMRAAYETENQPFTEAFKRGDTWEAARAFTAMWGADDPWENMPQPQRAQMAAQIHLIDAARPALCDDVGGMLAKGQLESLDIPVLVIEGSTSQPIMGAICEGLCARLPRAQRAMVLGAGHMLPLTHARQAGSEILRFLQTS